VLQMPNSCIHYSFRIGGLYASRARNADRLQVLGSENAPEAAIAAADAAAVNQGGDPGSRLSDRADADNLRPGGGVTLSDLLPFIAKSGSKVGPVEHVCRIGRGGYAADAGPAGCRSSCGCQRTAHEGNDIPRVIRILQIPLTGCDGQIPKYGCSNPEASPELLILGGIDGADCLAR